MSARPRRIVRPASTPKDILMNVRHVSLVGLLAASAVVAQDLCPRPSVQLSLNGPVSPGFAPGATIASPKQSVAGNPALNLAPTARVCYAVWADVDPVSGDNTIAFVRSTDGGWSWNPASQQTLWLSVSGEGGIDGDIEAFAYENSVFVLFATARNPDGTPGGGAMGAANDSCWVLASNDQGQTWQQICISQGRQTALPGGELFQDVDAPRGALDSLTGRLHVCYETDFAVPTDFDESVVYQAVEFDGTGTLVAAFPNETLMPAWAAGAHDVDGPNIAAEGGIVAVSWQDESAAEVAFALNDADDTVTRVSIDGGLTFGPVVNHTNFTAQPEEEDGVFVAIDSATIVVASADSRSTASPDEWVYVNVSTDLGFTWTNGILVGSAVADVDGPLRLVGDDGNFVVVYRDARNSGINQTYVVADRSGGNDFINGTWVEVDPFPSQTAAERLSGNFDNNIDADVFGPVAAITTAFTTATGAGQQVAWTVDGGLTWRDCIVSQGGSVDVLGANVAVGVNYDINVIRNESDAIQVNGLKLGRLLDETGTGGGLVYEGFPSEAGGLALFLISTTAPTSNAIPFEPLLIGGALNFSIDGNTTLLASANSFQPIGADGTAVYPDANLFAQFGPLLANFGVGLYYVALTDNGGLLRSYTDPFRQN
jgi:hypothetical protein